MRAQSLNRLTTVLLTILLALTLSPLVLMFYTSFKPGGTLAKPVSDLLMAETATLKPGESLRFPLGQDMRKFSTLTFTLEKEGAVNVILGLIDIRGYQTLLPLERYLDPAASRQKVSIPLSDFDLSALNPHVPEKTAEELVFSSQEGGGQIVLKEARLVFRRFTFINYIDVWISGAFGRYLFNSALITCCVVLGNLIFASMAGYIFARK